MTCRTCKFFDIEAVKDKAGRVRKDRVVRCGWVFNYPMPDSIAKSYSWSPPRGRYMNADEGENCPVQETRQ